jgi:hypothetical protein
MPDMFCIDNRGSGADQEKVCIFTCDLNMGICPLGGTCIDPGNDTQAGLCLPAGTGQFSDPCSLAAGCSAGLVCATVDENYGAYCNRLCSSMFPCPYPFECILNDNDGSRWCAAPCSQDTECAMLGDWSCRLYDTGQGVCLPN